MKADIKIPGSNLFHIQFMLLILLSDSGADFLITNNKFELVNYDTT